MILDDAREARFDETMRMYEAKNAMETLSPYQKRFIAKGRLEGKREDLIVFLEARFERAPDDFVAAINRILSVDALTKLLVGAARVETLADFRKLLPE